MPDLFGGGTQKVTNETKTEPWAGQQPYLTGGGGQLPGYLMQTPDVTRAWMEWNDHVASGQLAPTGWRGSQHMPVNPPPMMSNYAQAQSGIGMPNWQPATPGTGGTATAQPSSGSSAPTGQLQGDMDQYVYEATMAFIAGREFPSYEDWVVSRNTVEGG